MELTRLFQRDDSLGAAGERGEGFLGDVQVGGDELARQILMTWTSGMAS
jgi:hypothetical protein